MVLGAKWWMCAVSVLMLSLPAAVSFCMHSPLRASSNLHMARCIAQPQWGMLHKKCAMRITMDGKVAPAGISSALNTQRSVDTVLIFGAGRLGIAVAEQMKIASPNSRIIGVTKSDQKHEKLTHAGAEAHLSVPSECVSGMENIVFLLNPFVDDFFETLDYALEVWKGSPGRFVFSSSVGVHQTQKEGGIVNEESRLTASVSPFAKNVLAAEKKVLERGGTVLRLSGLYCLELDRKAFLLREDVVKRPPMSNVPVVSYPDAGLAVVKALQSSTDVSGEAFIICDGNKQSVEEIYASSLLAGKYSPRSSMPVFEFEDSEAGMVYDASKARELLGWQPTSSFHEYCLEMALRGEEEDAAA